MAEPALDYAYRYLGDSRLEPDAQGTHLRLATCGGTTPNPRLFTGRVARPAAFADALLAVGAVARSRFHVPPAMLARILLLADPVVTAASETLRFEAFSSCCSAYARLDLLPGSTDGVRLGSGTTNVDLGAGVRAALAGVTETVEMRLDVGLDDLGIDVDRQRHAERRVALPSRWIRGFVEVQAIQAAMAPRLEVDGPAFRRFLRNVPRGAKGAVFVRLAGRDLVVGHRDAANAVAVGDPDRLRILKRLAPRVLGVRIFADSDGASAWCADLGDARFTLTLSAESWRGFSGEGRALAALSAPPNPALLARVRAALGWEPTIALVPLAAELEADRGAVEGALAALAASGLVGFDLSEQAYFHRVLPFVADGVERSQPRLARARQLVADGQVRIEAASTAGVRGETIGWVAGRTAEYRVRLGGRGIGCTCPWWGRHPGDRGPCAHILAVEIARTAAGSPGEALPERPPRDA